MEKKGFYLDWSFDWNLIRLIPTIELYNNSIAFRITFAWLPTSFSLVYIKGVEWKKESLET